MKTGKTSQGIGQVGGREKQREWIRGERKVEFVKRGNSVGRNDHWLNQPVSIFRYTN